ncbi:hypothetical protein L5G28_18345 [Gordonia sp. HY285]|uniref:Mce-associated membrane protein n=1 Tax=Gordonia liuliyuniae TaxID=2911517 RepID=A0ABS9IW45_9ACTN|nr:hypothetical protein [Gordonia liuliyuniae]MCF8589788.1 hypothetical protein [Gordonia liuliyuniae]MCF8612108.1 hypothetical protein [Gordonia liuliyuniae]
MTEPTRVRKAREQYDDAVRAERLARIAAAPELRARARRLRAALRLAAVAAVVVAVVALGVGLWGFFSADDLNADAAATDAAVADATSAVTTMLTPDPADASGYVDAISGDSTGEQRQRFDSGRDALVGYVSGLEVRPDGRVVSAGVESASDDSVNVLVVAQTTDPSLVGDTSGDTRVTVRVRMTPGDDSWLVSDTEVLS